MPRVLLAGFCAVPGPRRAGVQLRQVIRALSPHHSVDLLVVREGDQAYVERQGTVRVLRVPAPESDLKSQIQSFQRALKRQLDGADYDVVHCRDSWSGVTVLEARPRLDYAMVYDLTRAPLGESALDPELDAQYSRDEDTCLAAADLVLVPNPAAGKAIHGRANPERVMVAPPGVDVDRFDWEEPPTSGAPRIVYAGSIDPGRGVRVLIRAMAAIVREVDAKLVLAGPMVSAKFDQALRATITELGLTDRVQLLGPIDHDEIPALLATATVCVVPAASDLTPNPTVVYPTKLLEYMACKRAIVAPRRETVVQVIDNGREGLLFEPGDPIDLARKVLRLLGEPDLRDKLAAGAYERVRRELTASAARRALRSAYAVLAERFAAKFADSARIPAGPVLPKVEVLTEDEFEATVLEEPPRPPAQSDAGFRIGDGDVLEEALASLDGGTGSVVIAPPPPAPAGNDDWIVTNVVEAQVDPDATDDSDVTIAPIAASNPGRSAAPISLPVGADSAFVAGEIDVPTPPPQESKRTPTEFTAASTLLGNADPADPDTGSRTPPLARRDP